MPDITPQFVLSVIVVVMLSISILRKNNLLLMLRYMVIWIFIGLVLIFGYQYQNNLSDIVKRIQSEIDPSTGYANGQTIRYRMGLDGHFHVMVLVNGVPIQFLVDTGASDVALSQEDAIKAGIKVDQLNYSKAYGTANGKIYAAESKADIQIGQVHFPKFNVSINSGKMDRSLLGMELLSRFDSMKIDGNYLILEWNSR